VLLLLTAASVVWKAATDTAREQVQAQLALLGRWTLADPDAGGRTLTLDFHTGVTGRYVCTYPGGSGSGQLSFVVRQETLRRHILNTLQRRPALPVTYVFHAPPVPARSIVGRFGTTWHGTLLGDGNVLALYSPPLAAVVLRRRGAG
jgi:hypothetical protein